MLPKSLLLLATAASSAVAYVINNGTRCYVYPESLTHLGQPVDDTPSILQAFELCGTNGTVILTEHTFYVNQVMNITSLVNCDVELHGELQWSTNVPYWLGHSFPVVYANLSTSWFLGGENVTFKGFGKGVLNGNGRPLCPRTLYVF
jgi:galacturan 1,4-alpha-galacturonidase